MGAGEELVGGAAEPVEGNRVHGTGVDHGRQIARVQIVQEHEEGVRCVGAPIRDREGRTIASISASGPAQRLAPGRDREIARRLMAAAEQISRRLGYRPGKGGARKGS